MKEDWEGKAPLYDALVGHRALARASFHTPGHKSREDAFPSALLSLDLTELPDTDSLFEAEGCIRQAEQAAEQLFGTARTLFSAGGCTLCIQAMLRLAAPMGGKVIMGRVVHRSAVNAMALLGITPIWLMPRQDAGEGLPGRVQAEDVENSLKSHPDARAVYLTSPDYYGTVADIGAISAVCERARVPLLVDNAHGAHLWFVGGGMHPIQRGASMTACSAHKTLPVLTGGAWLNIQEGRFAVGAKEAMALFGSTSPSYPVMASLDLCRSWLTREGKTAFARLEEAVSGLRELAVRRGFSLPQGECDPVRLTLGTAPMGMAGEEAADWLRQRGIEPEYADGAHVVLILTPFNTQEEIGRLERAIREFPVQAPIPAHAVLPSLPPVLRSLREAVLSPSEWIPIQDAAGRIAAEAACPCPPGVPVVMPGEEVTEKSIQFLSGYGISALKVIK